MKQTCVGSIGSLFPFRALHPLDNEMLQERINLVGMLCQGAIERCRDLFSAPSLEIRLQRSPDQLAAGEPEGLGGGLGFHEQRVGHGDGHSHTRSITISYTNSKPAAPAEP